MFKSLKLFIFALLTGASAFSPLSVHAEPLTRVTYYYEQSTTASGAYTTQGTLACPYELQFGTLIEIVDSGKGLFNGDFYRCQDRYAELRLGWRFDVWLYKPQRLSKDYYEVNIWPDDANIPTLSEQLEAVLTTPSLLTDQ